MNKDRGLTGFCDQTLPPARKSRLHPGDTSDGTPRARQTAVGKVALRNRSPSLRFRPSHRMAESYPYREVGQLFLVLQPLQLFAIQITFYSNFFSTLFVSVAIIRHRLQLAKASRRTASSVDCWSRTVVGGRGTAELITMLIVNWALFLSPLFR